MPAPLRIGIAGCGKIAQVSHAPALAAIPGARIAALYDTDPARAELIRTANAPQALVYPNYEAFQASGLDAVTI